ncbi:hypothetical protein ABK040_004642 [Willaertia magna]
MLTSSNIIISDNESGLRIEGTNIIELKTILKNFNKNICQSLTLTYLTNSKTEMKDKIINLLNENNINICDIINFEFNYKEFEIDKIFEFVNYKFLIFEYLNDFYKIEEFIKIFSLNVPLKTIKLKDHHNNLLSIYMNILTELSNNDDNYFYYLNKTYINECKTDNETKNNDIDSGNDFKYNGLQEMDILTLKIPNYYFLTSIIMNIDNEDGEIFTKVNYKILENLKSINCKLLFKSLELIFIKILNCSLTDEFRFFNHIFKDKLITQQKKLTDKLMNNITNYIGEILHFQPGRILIKRKSNLVYDYKNGINLFMNNIKYNLPLELVDDTIYKKGFFFSKNHFILKDNLNYHFTHITENNYDVNKLYLSIYKDVTMKILDCFTRDDININKITIEKVNELINDNDII